MAKSKKALNDSLSRGVGVAIDYGKLHKEISRLKKQLIKVRDARRAKGLSVIRVNFVLKSLQHCNAVTQCQINMLEGY